jgi:DNA-binding CsgD family transcriptional regulator
MRGDHRRAQGLLEESLRLYQESGNRRGVAWALGGLGNLYSDLDDYEQAMQFFEEGLTLSRELGGAQPHGEFLICLGYESLLQGDYERAAALNEEAAVLFREHGHKGVLEFALDNLGWAALLSGDLERAKALHEESLVLCREVGDKYIAPDSLEGLACLAVTYGEAKRAATLFGAAEALRETAGYHQAQRERALREPYLASARASIEQTAWEEAWEEGCKMTFERTVKYALSEEESAPPTPPGPEETSSSKPLNKLTPREQEVARLVARGLSNREIASHLTLSEHTVATHVRNVLKKLGLNSRNQIAAYFTERH